MIAAKFFLNYKLNVKNCICHECSNDTFRYKVYDPVEKPTGTILVFHGFTKDGFNDPQTIKIGNALASSGYRVIIPNIESAVKRQIIPDSIFEIRDAIKQFEADKILASCFTSTLVLQAIGSGAGPNVKSVCTIGAISSYRAEKMINLDDQTRKMISEIDTSWINPIDYVVKQSLVLIHGANDPFAPASESLALYKRYSENNQNVRLCVTKFISHTNIITSERSGFDDLVENFDFFLK